jgi:hypothetical protein
MYYGVPGSGFTATCTVSGGGINTVTITSGGSGYASPPILTVYNNPSDSPTVIAVLWATLTAGVVTDVTIMNPGAGYNNVPTINSAVAYSGTPIYSNITTEALQSLDCYRLSMLGPPSGTDMNGVPLTLPQPLYPDVITMLRCLMLSQIIQPALTLYPPTTVISAQTALTDAQSNLQTAIQNTFAISTSDNM